MEKDKYKLLLARIEDLAESVHKHHRMANTDFLDPDMLGRAEDLLNNYDGLLYKIVGGYPEAERNIVLIYPDWMAEEELQSPISVLNLQWDKRYYKVTHRDILGSILGLGIKREKLGDIIVEDHYAYAIISKDICNFIIQSLGRVGKAPVTIEEITAQDMEIPEKKGRILRISASSMRLDCIASSGFSISRNKIVPHINGGMTRVNWQTVLKPDYLLKEGDMVSLRGRGRIKIIEVAGMSKRNRYHVIIERW